MLMVKIYFMVCEKVGCTFLGAVENVLDSLQHLHSGISRCIGNRNMVLLGAFSNLFMASTH